MTSPELRLANIKSKAEVAAALSAIERDLGSDRIVDLLDEAFGRPRGVVIGITGPPGAGKSTLVNAIIAEYRRDGRTVAVLAVDPSSKLSGGALLGDRVRMRTDPGDENIFIRSIAARDRLGGLSGIVYPISVLLRALYDIVMVESVGVGQSDTDIASVADTVVFCVQPNSGDALQFMKAGIAEIPDIAVVTKADLGASAMRALADLKGALSLFARDAGFWEPECLSISATHDGESLRQLFGALDRHKTWFEAEGRLSSLRLAKASAWLASEIREQFGSKGLEAASLSFFEPRTGKPFSIARSVLGELSVVRVASNTG
ncbi:MAG TPA: GTP-binding protein [Hyphomicrobiales bacterium]|nr:GTP-binding protein [Hyphomicrobiales bacterium]